MLGVVFRVGESRTDHTENDAGGLIRREAQQVHGSLNRHTLHVAGDQPGLARRNAHEFGSSFRFHDWHPLFLGLGLLVGGRPWKVRVGSEFPKLVSHHVFGDENGRNFLPLCTAKVIPTISGRTVDRRDQVFTTRRSLVSTAVSTFFIRWSSTKGPFFSDLGITAPTSGRGANDETRRGLLLIAGLIALGGHTPRGNGVTAAGASAFTTAERMVDRVHGHAANLGTTTEPAITASLAQGDVLVLDVADLAGGGEGR